MALWEKQRGLCALTGMPLDNTAELDHKVPRSRGGKNEIENVRWVLKDVNKMKAHLTDEEFMRLAQLVQRSLSGKEEEVGSPKENTERDFPGAPGEAIFSIDG